jgi:hypothetical protein
LSRRTLKLYNFGKISRQLKSSAEEYNPLGPGDKKPQ